MDLVQVGSDDLFSHLVSFRAKERNAPSGKGRNQACMTRLGLIGENGYRDLTELRAAGITKSLFG